jgi:hypothetical protein
MHIKSLLLLTAGIGACSSSQIQTLDEYGKACVGLNIAVVRDLTRGPNSYATRVGWEEKSYALANGHLVYVQPDRPNCEIHFEVDSEGIIVGYTPMGTGCRDQ